MKNPFKKEEDDLRVIEVDKLPPKCFIEVDGIDELTLQKFREELKKLLNSDKKNKNLIINKEIKIFDLTGKIILGDK